MRPVDRSLLMAAAAGLAVGLATAGLAVRPSQGQTAPAAAREAAAQAHFLRAATVLQHPRCMNCHTSTDFPRQGDGERRHIMQVRRGAADAGAPALPCSSCHQRQNGPSGVPGSEVWHLAPLRMAWEGLSAGAICRSLTDPARGGMTHEKLIEHLATDHLVAWAWDPGLDLAGRPRATPPLSHQDFVETIRQWVANGAACPSP